MRLFTRYLPKRAMSVFMNDIRISGRLGWLSSALVTQRNNLSNTLLRLKDAGLRAGTSLNLHRKFMRLLEQVATDRDKELAILNEIEAIEKQHRAMKRSNLLRCVTRKHMPHAAVVDHPEDGKHEHNGLLRLFGIFWLLSSTNNKRKKQQLAAD